MRRQREASGGVHRQPAAVELEADARRRLVEDGFPDDPPAPDSGAAGGSRIEGEHGFVVGAAVVDQLACRANRVLAFVEGQRFEAMRHESVTEVDHRGPGLTVETGDRLAVEAELDRRDGFADHQLDGMRAENEAQEEGGELDHGSASVLRSATVYRSASRHVVLGIHCVRRRMDGDEGSVVNRMRAMTRSAA